MKIFKDFFLRSMVIHIFSLKISQESKDHMKHEDVKYIYKHEISTNL